jgi:ABC-type nickel/cobalt efflux system permease component RcnA
MTTTTILLIVVAIIVVALAAWYVLREQQSKKLRSRFGPEYDHALHEYGNQAKAEHALKERQRRLEKIHIRPLTEQERDRLGTEWTQVQSRFVDDPAATIQDADRLVNNVMTMRGYPMTDFENRADDLSVDHPHVVSNYRAAHAIAVRRDEGQATTEDLRKALVHYRDLFDELLEAHVAHGVRETRS